MKKNAQTERYILNDVWDDKNQILRVGVNEEVISYRDYKTGEVVNAGSSVTYTIYASSGKIARINSCGCLAQAIAGSTGDHSWSLSIGDVTSVFMADRIASSSGAGASNLSMDTDNYTQVSRILGREFSDTVPLKITYTNSTDTNQTGIRLVNLTYVERSVISD